MFRIGFLAIHTDLADLQKGSGPSHTSHGAFVEGMRSLGWQDGRNIRIYWRSAESEYKRLPRLAEELVRIPVDVIVSFSEGAEATDPGRVPHQPQGRQGDRLDGSGIGPASSGPGDRLNEKARVAGL